MNRVLNFPVVIIGVVIMASSQVDIKVEMPQNKGRRNDENDTFNGMYDICNVGSRGGSKAITKENEPL